MAPVPVSQASRPPRNILYIIRLTQSGFDAELAEIRAAGIELDPDRDKAFTAPPSELRYHPDKRAGFQKVMATLQPHHDRLVVTRMNRLGRTDAEVLETVKLLEWKQGRLRCLDLGDHRAELTRLNGRESEHGPLIMRTIAACVALKREERDRRRNARHKTKRQGRPPALKTESKCREAVDRCQVPGATITAVAKVMGTSRPVIYRALKATFGPQYHAKLAALHAATKHARNHL
jgi:DNA invertase Pin-like site-specific DNA recombinase